MDSQVCQRDCASIPHASSINPLSLNSCLCHPGYVWNGSACLLNCSQMTYSNGTSLNTTACTCFPNFYWNGSFCKPNCTLITGYNNSNFFIDSAVAACLCPIGYYWENGCQLDCSGMYNTNGTDGLDKCKCSNGYVWTAQGCTLYCQNMTGSTGEYNLNECYCKQGYTWNYLFCDIECSLIPMAIVDPEPGLDIFVTTQCNCASGWTWNSTTLLCQKKA